MTDKYIKLCLKQEEIAFCYSIIENSQIIFGILR